MNKDEILTLLSNSYESSNETRKASIRKLYQYINLNLNQFLDILISILQSEINMKIKFLSLSLIRRIYEYVDSDKAQILAQKSKTFFDIFISLLQSEIATQSGATIAEIIIFLSTIEMDIDPIVHQLITNLPSMKVKIGIFEFLNIICSEIDFESNFYIPIINFIINPQLLSQSNQNDIISGIQLLSQIILNNPLVIDNNLLPQIVNFLISILPVFEYKSAVYTCFSILLKKCPIFQQIELNQPFYTQLMNDLTNGTFIYSISISHHKSNVEVGLDEENDIDSAAFSVIEQFISTHKNSSLKIVTPFLTFDSENPQIRENAFKVLSAIIINCSIDEEILFQFLGATFLHLRDSSARVKEASLWALHAFCYTEVIPIDDVKIFFEKGNIELFETLSSFFAQINDNDNSVLAAISCEILSLFAMKNADAYFQQIFDLFFRFISFSISNMQQFLLNSNLAFVQIRIEKVLIRMCSILIEKQELIFHILSIFSTFLNQTLLLYPTQLEYILDFHDFLCEIIDTFFQSNSSFLNSLNFQSFQVLLQSLINDLQKAVTPTSVSAITSIFLSLGDSSLLNPTSLFQLFESYPNESINSIVRYSIKQSNYLLIQKFWPIIPDKHSIFFVPLIKQIENESIILNESHIQIFETLFDPLFLSDFMIILEITVSNSEIAVGWIEFGFKILKIMKQLNMQNNNQNQGNQSEIANIFEENLSLIINFFQSAVVSNIQLSRKLIIEYDLIYLLNYAVSIQDLASSAKSILIALNYIT